MISRAFVPPWTAPACDRAACTSRTRPPRPCGGGRNPRCVFSCDPERYARFVSIVFPSNDATRYFGRRRPSATRADRLRSVVPARAARPLPRRLYGVPTHAFFVGAGLLVAGPSFLSRPAGGSGSTRPWDGSSPASCWAAPSAPGSAPCGATSTRRADPSLAGALVDGGKSILGGLSGAYVGALVAKRLLGYRRSTGDLFAPAVALGMAVGRVGCFLTEQIGTPTSLPWGIQVGPGDGGPHPPLPMVRLGRRHAPVDALRDRLPPGRLRARSSGCGAACGTEGDVFKLYLLGYALFRFWVEFVRGGDQVLAGLTRPQLFLIPSALVLGRLLRPPPGRPVRCRRGGVMDAVSLIAARS